MRQFNLSLSVFFLALILPAQAIVFTLKPGGGKGSIHTILEPKIVLEERVTINGERGDLSIGITPLSLGEAIGNLQPLLTDYRSVRGHNSVLIESPRDGKWVTRTYILSMGKQFQTMVFTLQLPEAAFDDKREPEWPRDLPSPNADKIGPVMAFAKRGAIMASFSSRNYPEVISRQYATALRAEGWKPPAGQADAVGGLFIHEKRGKLLVFNVLPDADGMTRAAVFVSDLGSIDNP